MSCMVTPHFLQGSKQHPAGEMTLVCMQWFPPVSSGSGSRRGSWGITSEHCRLAREPGWSSHLLSTCRGNVNNGAHRFLQYWVVPWAPRRLSSFPNLLYTISLLLCRSCSNGSQLPLRRNCSKYSRYTFDVFWGGGKLSIHLKPRNPREVLISQVPGRRIHTYFSIKEIISFKKDLIVLISTNKWFHRKILFEIYLFKNSVDAYQ